MLTTTNDAVSHQRSNSRQFAGETTLFNIQLEMRERDLISRLDVTYPYTRKNADGAVLEQLERPSMFDVRFIYSKKKGNATFRIFALRLDKPDENYEIEIVGSKRIKSVMRQFKHEYLAIVDNLRVMGDALVLLNPIKAAKNQFFGPTLEEEPTDLSQQESIKPKQQLDE